MRHGMAGGEVRRGAEGRSGHRAKRSYTIPIRTVHGVVDPICVYSVSL